MMRTALLTAAFSLAASSALAAPAPAWTVDKAASAVRFSSTFNGDAFTGSFRRWDAAIRFDPKALAVLSRSYVEMGLLDKEPDMSKLYTEQFLPKQ